MLVVSDISVSYGAHRALDGASVKLEPGEIVVILGANGAGKSSLLKAIAGTCEGKVSGNVELDGKSLSLLAAEEIVINGLAFVPEGRGIFGELTVRENLLLGAHAKQARPHQERNLRTVYELFPKLQERAAQVSRTMSGGEQQMVAIGRAMMANPKYLMLDEPSLGLSPLLCKELFQSLAHIRDSGIGVLMVEQNAKQSLAIADRAYLLENGEIIAENSARAMLKDPSVQAAYLGGAKGHQTAAVPTSQTAVGTAPAGDRPATASRTFIQPEPPAASAKPEGAEIDVDIDKLVSRASEVAGTQPRTIPSAAATQAPPPSYPTEPKAPSPSPPSSNGRDQDLINLLADFETAARNARNGAADTRPGQSPGRPVAEPATSETESLPEIPVFRKSKITIYRRSPGGDLVKTEER